MFVNMPKEKSEDLRNMRKEENLSNVVNTSERRILFYKTKICPWYIKGKCERRKTCLYAHAQNELRELPNLCKTSLCPKLKINELCNDKKCKYAHTNIELRATENLYKTALCESFIKGKCFSGQFCRYAHGHNELRENPMEITDKNIIIGTSKNKNEKIDFEKKKSLHNNSHNINQSEAGKRNETYCILPKNREIYINKLNSLTEDDCVYDMAETMDTQILNDTTTEHSYDCNNRKIELSYKKGINNSGVMGSHGGLDTFMKQEENLKFNEEQFLNDNLNVLGFLEDHNNLEKYGKNSGIYDNVNLNNFQSTIGIKGVKKNKDMYNSNFLNNSGNISNNSILNFNMENNPIDINTHNIEDNYYNFNAKNLDKMNYEDLFSDTSFTTINSSTTKNQSMNSYILNETQSTQCTKNGLLEDQFINRNLSCNKNGNNIRNINNSVNDCIKNDKDIVNMIGWDNFSLFGKTKSLIPENDYFKIFNYEMCNNMDNKIYENCQSYKNQIDKVDNSLFIL